MDGPGWNMCAAWEEWFIGNGSEWFEGARVFGSLCVVWIIVIKGGGRGQRRIPHAGCGEAGPWDVMRSGRVWLGRRRQLLVCFGQAGRLSFVWLAWSGFLVVVSLRLAGGLFCFLHSFGLAVLGL